MATRRPTRTITRLYLNGVKFPVRVRLVDKTSGVDLKHTAETFPEALAWAANLPAHVKQARATRRSRTRIPRQ